MYTPPLPGVGVVFHGMLVQSFFKKIKPVLIQPFKLKAKIPESKKCLF